MPVQGAVVHNHLIAMPAEPSTPELSGESSPPNQLKNSTGASTALAPPPVTIALQPGPVTPAQFALEHANTNDTTMLQSADPPRIATHPAEPKEASATIHAAATPDPAVVEANAPLRPVPTFGVRPLSAEPQFAQQRIDPMQVIASAAAAKPEADGQQVANTLDAPDSAAISPAAATQIDTQSLVSADLGVDLSQAEIHRPATSGSDAIRAAAQSVEHLPRVIETIANAARALSDRPIELTLNPEELGRVRMTLHATEGGMTVQLAIERPETLDLLRRNIDLLANDLRQAGYERLSFAFAGDQRAGGQPMPQQSDQAATTPDPVAPTPDPLQPQGRTLTGDGLDLRI